MDIPQWYNRKLWSTSKQSIDGKPVRSQSANYANRRSGFTNQTMPGNWANYLKVNNLTLPNRDRGFTYRYTLSNRPTKSTTGMTQGSFTTNYLNNLSPQINYIGRTNLTTATQALSLRPKTVTTREKIASIQNDSKPMRLQFPSKTIQPQYVEYDSDFYSLSKKYAIMQENTNLEKVKTEDDPEDDKKFIELEEPLLESVNISSSTPVPQNTPRFVENSSQETLPKKSILKKTVDIIYQPNIYQPNMYQNAKTRTLSASFKPMISSQPLNKFYEIRKNLQSAPGTKREVRFDMSINNVIEFSTNE